ncbi:hypothetical protein C0995_003635 [Termitomyces sp. Mi166|nr:hypothetical protein C0995_003635 [Termitomyces sp. Mi166\
MLLDQVFLYAMTFTRQLWDTAAGVLYPSNSNTQLARLPVLGYNTWNAYGCNIDEDLILTDASNALFHLTCGFCRLKEVGYNYINIDDCYAEKTRSTDGSIIEDASRFKRGMKNLTDEIHALGFKAGIYSDSGWFTCAGYPGSFGNEMRDAKTFYDWGFDYLK